MITSLLLGCSMSLAAPKPPPAPVALAELTAVSADGEQTFTLTGAPHKKTAIGQGPHLDPLSTALTPDLDRGEGELLWLTGYRLSSVNEPGDVRVTASLLVQLPPTGTGTGVVQALWHEDHMTVPTQLWTGSGTLTPGGPGAAQTLHLELTEAEYGDALTIDGLLRRD